MIYRERGCYNQIRFLSLNLSMKDWSEDKEEPLSLFEMVGTPYFTIRDGFDNHRTVTSDFFHLGDPTTLESLRSRRIS